MLITILKDLALILPCVVVTSHPETIVYTNTFQPFSFLDYHQASKILFSLK